LGSKIWQTCLADHACVSPRSESYALRGVIHADREALWAGNHEAKVLLRPMVTLNGQPVTSQVLSDVRFTIELVGREDSTTTKTETDLKFVDNKDMVRKFNVPEGTRRISFKLEATVKILSQQNRKETLFLNQTYDINSIDDTNQLVDIFLCQTSSGDYNLNVRGKNGEPKPNFIAYMSFTHAYGCKLSANLQSNGEGIIYLGPLRHVQHVEAELRTASSGQHAPRRWAIRQDSCQYPIDINCTSGETLRIPYMGDCSLEKVPRLRISLGELDEQGR